MDQYKIISSKAQAYQNCTQDSVDGLYSGVRRFETSGFWRLDPSTAIKWPVMWQTHDMGHYITQKTKKQKKNKSTCSLTSFSSVRMVSTATAAILTEPDIAVSHIGFKATQQGRLKSTWVFGKEINLIAENVW